MTGKLNNNKVDKPLKIVNKSKVLKKVTTKIQKLHGNEDTKKAAKLRVKMVAKTLKTAEVSVVTEPKSALTKKVKPLKEDALNKVHKPSIETDDNLMRVNTLNKTIKDATYELVKMGFKLDLPNLVKDDDFNKIKLSHKSEPFHNAHNRYGTEPFRKNEFNKIEFSHQSKPFNNGHKRYVTEPLWENDFKPFFIFKGKRISFMSVNTLNKSIEDATAGLIKMGFTHVKEVYTTYEEYIAALRNLKPNEFIMDFNVKNLIAFNQVAKKFLYLIRSSNYTWFFNNTKPYCLAILHLELQPGSIVLNMVSSGNAVTQITDELKNNCTIYNAVRRKYWPNFTIKATQNCPCEISVSEDMLSYRNHTVEYIFLDIHTKTIIESEKYLLHALTQFPNVKRIVVFGRSFEDVTQHVLWPCLIKTKNNFKLIDASKILKNILLENKNGCVITSSEHDLCDRSIIAVIDRCSDKKFEASDDNGEIENDDVEGEVSDEEDVQTSDNEELDAYSEDIIEELLKLPSKKKTPKSVKTNQKPV